RSLSAQVLAELRTTVEGLRPADLERDGLAAVLGAQLTVAGRAHEVPVDLTLGDLPGLEPDVEHQVLRVAQEAVTNALRHAGASGVRVCLGPDDELAGHVTLVVADDGRGFDPAARGLRSRRLGLTSMHERAASLGGALVIESAPGRGTTVRLRFPA